MKRAPYAAYVRRLWPANGDVEPYYKQDSDNNQSQCYEQAYVDASDDAKRSYQGPTNNRRNDNWYAFQNRLESEAHGPTLARQGIADDCKDRRRGHALPSHHQGQSQE